MTRIRSHKNKKELEPRQFEEVKEFDWRRILLRFPVRYRKIVFYIVLALSILWGVWKEREALLSLPLVSDVVEWTIEKPIPMADSSRFSILVSNLSFDKDREFKHLIIEDLVEIRDIQVLDLDRQIALDGNDPQKASKRGELDAVDYLHKSNAHVLLWGTVIKNTPKLRWTVEFGKTRTRRYPVTSLDQTLPLLFWEDLSKVLQLVAIVEYSEFMWKEESNFNLNVIKPYIERVQHLLDSKEIVMSDSDRAGIYFVLGHSLVLYGEQQGDGVALQRAVKAFQNVLEVFTRERDPLRWARAQNNLGNALVSLGRREGTTSLLGKAIEAHKKGLTAISRDQNPLDWAVLQSSLGIALSRLARQDNDTDGLEEALRAHQEALKVFNEDEEPLQWAGTYHNIGNVLTWIGVEKNDRALLDKAVQAYEEALRKRTRDRVPISWAMTQDALGNALTSLGERDTGTAPLKNAVLAYKAALMVRAREKYPIEWAKTQSNLGNALIIWGLRESGTEKFEEAAVACRRALEISKEVDLGNDVALIKGNLDYALYLLKTRKRS